MGDPDKKTVNDAIGLLKSVTCCKEEKCGHGSSVEKAYDALKTAMWEKPGLRLGYVLSRFNRWFRGDKKKPDAKPPTSGPGGAGAEVKRHDMPEYKLAMVGVLNITLTTMSKSPHIPPSGEHRFNHFKRLVHLLKFKKPSMKPADANHQKKIARSLIWYIQGDSWVVPFLEKYGFAKELKKAHDDLKKQGGPAVDAVAKPLLAAVEKVREAWNKDRKGQGKTEAVKKSPTKAY
jgi:hypothetical protein